MGGRLLLPETSRKAAVGRRAGADDHRAGVDVLLGRVTIHSPSLDGLRGPPRDTLNPEGRCLVIRDPVPPELASQAPGSRKADLLPVTRVLAPDRVIES